MYIQVLEFESYHIICVNMNMNKPTYLKALHVGQNIYSYIYHERILRTKHDSLPSTSTKNYSHFFLFVKETLII